MVELTSRDANKENLLDRIDALEERLQRIETYALTSQNIDAENVTTDELVVNNDATVGDELVVGGDATLSNVSASQLTVGTPTPTAGAGDVVAQDQGYFGGGLQVQGSSVFTSGVGAELAWLSTYTRLISYNRGTSSDQPLYLRGSLIYLQEAGSTIATLDNADFYTAQLTDYSGSSSITGWSSFTNKKIYYRTLGKWVMITFYIAGTSNTTTVQFTVPYASKNVTDYYTEFAVRAQNSGVWGNYMGLGALAPNSSTVNCYTTNSAATPWTASNTKAVLGNFTYERA